MGTYSIDKDQKAIEQDGDKCHLTKIRGQRDEHYVFVLGMLPTQQKLRSTSVSNIEQIERFGLNLTAKLAAKELERCKEW